MEGTVITKGVHHLLHCGVIQAVFPVVSCDCILNSCPTRDIGLPGFTILLQLPVFAGVLAGMRVDRQAAQSRLSLKILPQFRIGTGNDAIPHNIYVAALLFLILLVHIGQRRFGPEKGLGLIASHASILHRYQNVLTDGIFKAVLQHFLWSKLQKPAYKLILLGAHLFIESCI